MVGRPKRPDALPLAAHSAHRARPRRNAPIKRLKVVLVFGVVVLGGLIMLGVGWNAGRQARLECEAIARDLQTTGEHQYDVKHCLAARLLNRGA